MVETVLLIVVIDTGTDEEIPLPNVKMPILKKIVEYCEKHRADNPPEIEKPLKSNNLNDVVAAWDAEFINIPNLEDIFEIILAANYLDVRSLLDLGCAKVATLLKGSKLMTSLHAKWCSIGKTAEEIRKTFNIQNDFTPEEEQQIKEENKWAED
jgi:S-phase kinase-associated protein 1